MSISREDTPTIMDGLVVRYSCCGYEISASRNGVMIQDGGMCLADARIERFTETLERARRQHLHLRAGAATALEESKLDALLAPPLGSP